MNILICLIIIAITGILLMKRYQPQPILIGMGILMMFIAYEGNWIHAILDESQTTGILAFDAMDIVRITTSENVVSLGLMIMTCAGYAKYMEHIGAGTRLAHTFIKPLYRLNRPYIVLALMFLLNMGLSICVPNPLSLALLMMVTIYPVLLRLGVSPVGAAAVIATGHLMDVGPGAVSTLLIAKTLNIPVPNYFVGYQLRLYFLVAVVTAVAHFLWQRYRDRLDGPMDAGVCESIPEAPIGPKIYMIFPLLPLCFILGFSQYGLPGVKMNVTLAMMLAFGIALLAELIRHRNLRTVLKSTTVFFEGMGNQFSFAVTLIIGGQVFAQGLVSLGLIDSLVSALQTLSLNSVGLTSVMGGGMLGLSMVTGSNVAPLFTVVPLVPDIVSNLGLDPITTMLGMQNGASLGLFLSPISPVMVGVAGVAHIKSVDLLKRTSVPVLVALITSCVGIWILY
ncbi:MULTISPECIES: C4-dicarboxylate transporter DcuC [Veillonella]|uniref:C4-dicarboxylate transporter DcuC n=1 Tax=Veillonella TaxID=29465 RepID=UPI0023B17A02|nr:MULTISPECIES: C4-dicarboxylate transporter DcuC [Veillonella]MDE8713151.1 C4-dicarboxylate transporter DcuC [Veillonella atypica]MDU4009206.1 C4-dicarboxylate transporter DcuC [Veillonella sp.]